MPSFPNEGWHLTTTLMTTLMTNDYTNPNTNHKTLTTLTLPLVDPHGLINKSLSAIPSPKTSMPANTLCTEICVDTTLILILTLYDVNLALADA